MTSVREGQLNSWNSATHIRKGMYIIQVNAGSGSLGGYNHPITESPRPFLIPMKYQLTFSHLLISLCLSPSLL